MIKLTLKGKNYFTTIQYLQGYIKEIKLDGNILCVPNDQLLLEKIIHLITFYHWLDDEDNLNKRSSIKFIKRLIDESDYKLPELWMDNRMFKLILDRNKKINRLLEDI